MITRSTVDNAKHVWFQSIIPTDDRLNVSLLCQFSRTNSRVKRHFWGSSSGKGFRIRWIWIHELEFTVLHDSILHWRVYIPSFKSASTYFHISFCFSSECLWGGARLKGSCHFSPLQPWAWSEVVQGSLPSHQLSLRRKDYLSNRCHRMADRYARDHSSAHVCFS